MHSGRSGARARLGVRPDLGNGVLAIVPQGQSTVQGEDIRLGSGSADVLATHHGTRYVTRIDVSRGVHADQIAIGHTLPRDSRPATVTLDGRTVHNYTARTTNRGVEITVPTGVGHHALTMTT